MIPRKNTAAAAAADDDEKNETIIKLGLLLPRVGPGLITQERIDKVNSIGVQGRCIHTRTDLLCGSVTGMTDVS